MILGHSQPPVRRTLCLLLGIALAAPAARAGELDFAALQGLIGRGDLGSVEELLAVLPAGQRSHYTLVFDSRSLQGASAANPRVILYGNDARFILTFNGSAQQRGYRSVETMEFDEAQGAFRLRELEFAPGVRGAAAVTISEVNPPRCQRCHGTPAQPVWDTFPLWPGAYGERYRATLSATERAGLAGFLAQQPAHPRYRYLLDSARFADPQTFRPSALTRYAGAQQEPPNAELGMLLARLQFQSIARQLERRPEFASYEYLLLGVADNTCGQLADFYPDELWRGERAAFERFAAESASANARQSRLKLARLAASRADAADAAVPVNDLVALRFVAETALGVSTRPWTLALEKGTYDFTAPAAPNQPLRAALLARVAHDDPAVRELSFDATSAVGDRYCSYLKRRSRSALAPLAARGAAASAAPPSVASELAFPGTAAAADALRRPAALQLCVNCHETGVAPRLPFSDPAQLKQLLRAAPAPHGVLLDEISYRLSPAAGAHRMPLGVTLPDDEWRGLEAYFVALAADAQ